MWGLQSPEEVLDWQNDWSDWLMEGDAIVSTSWTIDNDGTIVSDSLDTDGSLTIAVVSGLTLGKSYQLRNTVTSDQGRIGVRDITIRCGYR